MNVWMKGHAGEWCFEYSDTMYDIQDEIYDLADKVADSPSKAEKRLQKILDREPYAFDAYYHLSYILYWRHRINDALALLKSGFDRASELFPPEFALGRSRLPWGIIENRPFLRMYEALGSRYLDLGDHKSAIKIFEDIIAMNPDDNQGIREILVNCYFQQGDLDFVSKLCRKYNHDTTPAIMYGKVLVLFKLGKLKEAERACSDAIEYGGNIARELVKNKHKFVDSEDPGYVVVGSTHEAYLYWKDFGRYWAETPGAIAFVRECLKIINPKCDR